MPPRSCFGLGAFGAALAPSTAWLIFARVVAGIAIGVASFVAPLYISEIAPVEIRGKLVSINQLALTIGIVISYLIDYAFAGSQSVALDVCRGGDSGRRFRYRPDCLFPTARAGLRAADAWSKPGAC